MPRRPAPTIEERIISALRVATRFGHGPLSVTMLRRYPGLISRRYGEVFDAMRRLVAEKPECIKHVNVMRHKRNMPVFQWTGRLDESNT